MGEADLDSGQRSGIIGGVLARGFHKGFTMKLSFGRGNAKLDALEQLTGRRVYTFSVLSGHTCPYAKDCRSSAVERDGKLSVIDGPDTLFRCFSASQEAFYRNVYEQRKANGDIITVAASDRGKAAELLAESIPRNAGIVRIHVGGDFKTQAYFDTWILAAHLRPDVWFYAYTKSLIFWVRRREALSQLDNFRLTASFGGYHDRLIGEYNLRYAKVVFSEGEAADAGLPIDHDDSHALFSGPSFALLLHGTQPKESEAAIALRRLNGLGSYTNKRKRKVTV